MQIKRLFLLAAFFSPTFVLADPSAIEDLKKIVNKFKGRVPFHEGTCSNNAFSAFTFKINKPNEIDASKVCLDKRTKSSNGDCLRATREGLMKCYGVTGDIEGATGETNLLAPAGKNAGPTGASLLALHKSNQLKLPDGWKAHPAAKGVTGGITYYHCPLLSSPANAGHVAIVIKEDGIWKREESKPWDGDTGLPVNELPMLNSDPCPAILHLCSLDIPCEVK